MKPRVRRLEPQWIRHQGQPMLLLRDRLGLLDSMVAVAPTTAVLLSLCDGTRDHHELCAEFAIRTGVEIVPADLGEILEQLDQALVLEGPRFRQAYQAAVDAYRAAPHRTISHADGVYPCDPQALTRMLRGYGNGVTASGSSRADAIRGIVSPHIDYQRGGPIYAQVWERAAEAVRAAEVVVVFGTDHSGGPGQVTLTPQHYATPYGVLPTERSIVAALAEAIGPENAYAEELHHRDEHSIELAAVWLHYIRQGQPCPIVPILCGSFHPFTHGDADPADDVRLERLVEALGAVTSNRRVLAVAAGDLAHVGPAFADELQYGPEERAALREADASLLAAICDGDADRFLGILREEHDQRKVCGLPPIYLMLRYLGATSGEITGYDQCPADAERTSWVSVGGVLLH